VIFPLMKNNILKSDLDLVIKHLKKKDPILTNGPEVRKFEKLWSKWLGVKYSVFVNSGSSANFISLHILKSFFPNGGEVIVSPLNWVSDIVSILNAGFIPKFVDINLSTLSLDNKMVLKNINKNTKAILMSHIQGFNGFTNELLKSIKKNKIFLIEDVCESHGAVFNSSKLGSFGDISNFSFYYAHHLSTIEGGMICTNDRNIYELARMSRSHGMLREVDSSNYKRKIINKYPKLNKEFIFVTSGFNMRNDEIGAIIGQSQMKRIDNIIKKRNKNLLYFLASINKKKYFTNFNIEGCSNYALNLIQLNNSKKDFISLTNRLKKNKIEFRVGSAGGGNQLRQPYLKNFIKKYNIKPQTFTNTEKIHNFALYLGNYPDLSIKNIDFICKVINDV